MSVYMDHPDVTAIDQPRSQRAERTGECDFPKRYSVRDERIGAEHFSGHPCRGTRLWTPIEFAEFTRHEVALV